MVQLANHFVAYSMTDSFCFLLLLCTDFVMSREDGPLSLDSSSKSCNDNASNDSEIDGQPGSESDSSSSYGSNGQEAGGGEGCH